MNNNKQDALHLTERLTSEADQVSLRSIAKLMNEHEIAEILGVSTSTVRRWRLLGAGPKYIKIGAAVRYSPDSIAAFLESCPRGGGRAPAVA